VLLKLTCPGVPDLYQGTELWDFSLVDPDNRRPVDYRRRRDLLANLRRRVDQAAPDLTALARELVRTISDGTIKLYLIHRTLTCRRSREGLFVRGSYLPLKTAGTRREHVCAFARSLDGQAVVVVVPRLVARLTEGALRPPLGPAVWQDTHLRLPQRLAGRTFRNLYTGEVLRADEGKGVPGLPLGKVLGQFPVALLEADDPA
jgi:(1->4)-alpha-D-glucan 1-alpha-D-glucosylmutase